ncbi:MAG: cyclic nucleotide-binding domain-containing protein [Elusimicrobiota bacterium]|jgi:CRP-like cAMP-binding protein
MEPLQYTIARHEFFRDFKPQHLQIFQDCASDGRYGRDQFLLRQGQGAERFFLIRKGEVRLELLTPEYGPIPIQTVGPGEVVGWSWIVPPYKSSFDARAVEALHVIVFDTSELRRRCEQDFELGYRVLQKFTAALSLRLDAVRARLVEYHVRQERGY